MLSVYHSPASEARAETPALYRHCRSGFVLLVSTVGPHGLVGTVVHAVSGANLGTQGTWQPDEFKRCAPGTTVTLKDE